MPLYLSAIVAGTALAALAGSATAAEGVADAATAPKVVSRGEAAGTYQAFPDMCRLDNGDILAVFYAGYQHVSLPREPDWPRGGRICMIRSRDEGKTWSAPEIVYDDEFDNRDPHIAQMPDGSLICTFFSLRAGDRPPGYRRVGTRMIRSKDGGKTWDTAAQVLTDENWCMSAPVRVLADGSYILGIYHYEPPNGVYGAVIRSTDGGRTWTDPLPIGKDVRLPGQDRMLQLDESDIVTLKDGTLYAIYRSSQPGVNMHYATSADLGKTWTQVKSLDFPGHAPYFCRLKDGAILMAHRLPQTALHISRDDAKTWQGPYPIDDVGGAYASIVECRDGSVLIIYYTEGADSVVRVRRFRVDGSGLIPLPL